MKPLGQEFPCGVAEGQQSVVEEGESLPVSEAEVLASLGRGEEVEELIGELEEGEQGLVRGLLAATQGEEEQAR